VAFGWLNQNLRGQFSADEDAGERECTSASRPSVVSVGESAFSVQLSRTLVHPKHMIMQLFVHLLDNYVL